jgi:hypothetical protein
VTPEQQVIDDSVNETLGILFGTSALLKLLVAIGIIIAVMVGVAQYTPSPVVQILSGVLTMIALTFLGLMPIYILLIMILSVVLILLLKGFVTTARESG